MLRRVWYTRAVLAGKTPIIDARKGPWWLKIQPWRWPRATIPYDVITVLNMSWLVFADVPSFDPIGRLLGG